LAKIKKNEKVKYEYYRKVLNPTERMALGGLSEFKVGIHKVERKHKNLIKSYLNISFNEILNNIDDFDRASALVYLKYSYDKALIKLYKLEIPNFKELNLKKQIDITTLKEAIEFFVKRKEFKNTAIGTLKNYNGHTRSTFLFFKENDDVDDITTQIAYKYQEFLKNELGLGNSAINNKTAFLSGVYKELIRLGKVEKNPFTMEYMEVVESSKEELDDSDIKNLVDGTDDKNLKLCLALGIFSGFRIGEIFGLQVENINLDENFIESKLKDTNTKKHTRTIPINPKLKKILIEVIGDRKNGRLVYHNSKLVTESIQSGIIGKYFKKILKNKNKTFHSTRSSFAQKIENFNLKDIKILMGHKQKDITIKSYLKSRTNWDKKMEMINQINYKDVSF